MNEESIWQNEDGWCLIGSVIILAAMAIGAALLILCAPVPV